MKKPLNLNSGAKFNGVIILGQNMKNSCIKTPWPRDYSLMSVHKSISNVASFGEFINTSFEVPMVYQKNTVPLFRPVLYNILFMNLSS